MKNSSCSFDTKRWREYTRKKISNKRKYWRRNSIEIQQRRERQSLSFYGCGIDPFIEYGLNRIELDYKKHSDNISSLSNGQTKNIRDKEQNRISTSFATFLNHMDDEIKNKLVTKFEEEDIDVDTIKFEDKI